MIEYQRLGGTASSGGVEKQGAGPKRLPQNHLKQIGLGVGQLT
jgi:hypothetical protein